MPTTTTTKTKAAATVAGLSEKERQDLLKELLATSADAPAPVRKLTPRERATASLLRERDHLDGCPVFEDAEHGGARTEAYDETRPANPGRGLPAAPVTVVRCLECAGSRYIDGTVRDNLVAALSVEADVDDTGLDGTL